MNLEQCLTHRKCYINISYYSSDQKKKKECYGHGTEEWERQLLEASVYFKLIHPKVMLHYDKAGRVVSGPQVSMQARTRLFSKSKVQLNMLYLGIVHELFFLPFQNYRSLRKSFYFLLKPSYDHLRFGIEIKQHTLLHICSERQSATWKDSSMLRNLRFKVLDCNQADVTLSFCPM